MKRAKDYKVFTVEEVNCLVPQLSYAFGLITGLAARLETDMRRLVALGVAPSDRMMKVTRRDSREVRSLKKSIEGHIAGIFRHYSAIQETGAVVQDIPEGIVSFYTFFGDHPVFITWQYGDEEVRWWHEVYENTEQRKPLPRTEPVGAILN